MNKTDETHGPIDFMLGRVEVKYHSLLMISFPILLSERVFVVKVYDTSL